jgi:Nitroreductase
VLIDIAFYFLIELQIYTTNDKDNIAMNETIKNILERRSIRSYENTQVKDEDLELIVKCGLYAATAIGKQPWHFTVLQNRKLMDKITSVNHDLLLNSPLEAVKAMASQPDFDSWRGAPTAIIVSGDGSRFATADCANAIQNMAVAAKSLGLGSCYMAAFSPALLHPEHKDFLEALGIPTGYTPIFALAVGYPAETLVSRAPRKENSINYVR